MSKNLRLGAASIAFSQPLYIESAASIVSQKEADGPLGDLFDLVCEDPMFGCDTWESAESTLQKETVTHAISKAKLSSEDIHVMDYGLRDSMNMGGCMAPAACDTIARSFSDFGRTPSDYDAVFTGDLGIIGQKILLDLLEEQNIRLSPIHKDCGILIYDNPSQDTHAGGSGCGCSAVVLASYILPKIVSGEWKRILFVPTGALLSKVSFNEGDSIPGIAHGVVIEHMEV